MERYICVACKGQLKPLGERFGFSILRCQVCGLGVTYGVGALEQYSTYHRDDVYGVSKPQFRNIFQKRVSLVENFLSKGKVLEVGSSIGLLLSVFKERGWEVSGIEPSKTAYRLAKREGIPTQNISFEKAKPRENFYDLVVMNHVLEHMEDPVRVLEKIKRVLKKGGYVFIDVPNFGGIKAMIRGASWQYILPGEHKWHFTKRSLCMLLERTGFEPVYWETRSGIWDYGKPELELWQSLVGGKKRFFKNIVTAIPAYVVGKLGLGSGLSVVAKTKR